MTRINKYHLSATLDASGDATEYTKPTRGKVLAVQIKRPTNSCTVDLDTEDELKSQKIADISSGTSDLVLYPRTPSQDHEGTDVTFDGSNEIYEPFVVDGRIKLSVAGGTQDDEVEVSIIMEEF
ncbi:MAG: hypothetical protein ACOC5T_04230 [Elusimicrobiota bacterium]